MTRERIVRSAAAMMQSSGLWQSSYRELAVGPLIATICAMEAINFWSDRHRTEFHPKARRAKLIGMAQRILQSRKAWLRSFLSLSRFVATSLHRYHVLMVGMTTDRYLHSHEQVDVFLRPLREWLEPYPLRSIHMEYAPGGEVRLPHSDHTVEIELIQLLHAFVFQIVRRVTPNHGVLDERAQTFVKQFATNMSMSNEHIAQICRKTILSTYIWYKVWRILLGVLRPSVVFVVTYYSALGWGLCAASRSLSSSCADLQHGVQGPLHPAYGMFPKPTEDVMGHLTLPTHYWVWSEDEKAAVQRWCDGSSSVIVGGNPWLEKLKREMLSSTDEALCQDGFSTVFLCTLQPGFPLPDWFEQVLQARSNWLFVLRLHPGMRREHKSIARNYGFYSNVRVDDGSSHVLSALQNVTLHVTKHSTTVLEAKALGIQSIILGYEPGGQIYRSEVESGFAVVVETAEEFIWQAENTSTRQRMKPTPPQDTCLGTAMKALCHETGLIE